LKEEHFRVAIVSNMLGGNPILPSRRFVSRFAALYWANGFEFSKPAYIIRVRPK
jgi:hypothetical protein